MRLVRVEIPCPECGVAMQCETTGVHPQPNGETVVDGIWYCFERDCDGPYTRKPDTGGES